MMDKRLDFTKAANPRPRRVRGWPHSYDALIKTIDALGQITNDLNSVEPELRAAFEQFLTDSGFHLARKNFKALLAEKSGNKFLRNDNTVGWYHEFIPIMMVLSSVRKGHHRKGVDLKDIESYGGLEVAICTHLRHDSVEDHILSDDPQAGQNEKLEALRQQQHDFLKELHDEGHGVYTNTCIPKIKIIVNNIDLMSQRVSYNAEGVRQKEDVIMYIRRLCSSNSNPIVYILKQADIAHNFATMFGAEKFSPERRAKRCNEKENMYGARQDYYDRPKAIWKPFSNVITNFDGVVGDLLYKHFRYLENVDLFYIDSQYAFQRDPNDDPVSSRFLKDALRVDLPEIIHPLHIGHKRMMESVDPVTNPDMLNRLLRFMDYVIKPAIEHRRDRFPYIFSGPSGHQPAPSPVA